LEHKLADTKFKKLALNAKRWDLKSWEKNLKSWDSLIFEKVGIQVSAF